MNALRRIWNLLLKEFTLILKDPKSRFVVIGPPIIQFFVFGYAATYDVTDVQYAVFDEDRSPASRELLAEFSGSRDFRLTRTLQSPQAIPEVINQQIVRLVIHIPADYSERLYGSGTPRVQIILDGRNSNVAAIASGYARTIVNDYSRRLAERLQPARTPATSVLETRAWFNDNLRSRWFIVSALSGIISTVVVILLASLSVAREREFGTFDQLLVAPYRPAEILIGKAMPGMVFGLLDALALSAAAVLWFEVPFRGSLLALLIALSLFIGAIVGIGLFLSSLAATMQQALLGSFAFIMPAIILAGFTTPIENMPGWLQALTQLNPLRYIVTALRQIFLEGADLPAIWPQLWPLTIIGGLTLSAAAWMFRHRTS